ncbi:MAG: hypothetical protein H6684_11505 [Deltaproteobacteria bacterium]|nr:hypothetical protein [Deltaproteobacteria bacterium]MCB9478365.1 hypothetical protein [Deltaproteobacteria bacterium]MCB9489349.1 hypothetical protein [Deltaproteobacteria bacterium]
MKRKEKKGDIWKFSLTLGCMVSLIGALRWHLGGMKLEYAYIFWGVGATAALLGLIAPPVMRPVYKGGMFVADKISWVVTRVVLTVVYIVVFIPYGLIFRLFRKDLLDRRLHPDWPTYWKMREDKPFDPKRAERLF